MPPLGPARDECWEAANKHDKNLLAPPPPTSPQPKCRLSRRCWPSIRRQMSNRLDKSTDGHHDNSHLWLHNAGRSPIARPICDLSVLGRSTCWADPLATRERERERERGGGRGRIYSNLRAGKLASLSRLSSQIGARFKSSPQLARKDHHQIHKWARSVWPEAYL